MFVKVHGTKDYVGGNTQSCADLANYLEKENEDKDLSQCEYFFNNERDLVTAAKVIQDIDKNVNTRILSEKQAKFYMISINPSQRELQHMAKLATAGREVSSISEMSDAEKMRYNLNFKEYVNKTMGSYSQNFNRGITLDNLVYYAKIEQQRTYKGTDQDVKDGLAKLGEKKPGFQSHAHVIVSRLDKDKKMSLSPLANSRGSDKHQLNGKSIQVGFNRDAFKDQAERTFDTHYNYHREKGERFRVQNPYYGLHQMVEGKVKGKAIHQALSIDSSGTLLGAYRAYNAIKQVNNIVKDLSLVKDFAKTPILPPGNIALQATKAIARFIGKLKDTEMTLEP